MMSLNLKKSGFAAAVLLGLIVIGYANSLHNAFMLDDYIILFGEKGVSNKNIISLFAAHQGNFYRPVGHLYMMLLYALFENNVLPYHVANLFLFFIVVFLFYYLIEKISGHQDLALLTSALYAVHPINSMLINYVTATVITTFVLMNELCILSFWLFLERRQKIFYVVSVLFFILALLSHEMSLAMPLYLAGMLYFLKRAPLKRIVFLILPFFLLAVVYACLRMKFFSFSRVILGTDKAIEVGGSFIPSIATLIAWYVTKLVWPFKFLFLWTGTLVKTQLLLKTFLFIIAVGGFLYVVLLRWRAGLKAFLLWIFGAGFIPVAFSSFTYLPFLGPIIEPHWFYFSSIGFFALAAYLFLSWKEKLGLRIWMTVIASLIVLNIFLLRENNKLWKDQKTYCEYWLKLNPRRNLTPYYGLGKAYMNKKDYAKAAYYFQKGIDEVNYSNIFVLSDLGYCYLALGNETSAQKMLEAALNEDINYSYTYHYIGLLALEKNNPSGVVQAFSKAVQLYPKLFGSLGELALTNEVPGMTDQVWDLYRQIITHEKSEAKRLIYDPIQSRQ